MYWTAPEELIERTHPLLNLLATRDDERTDLLRYFEALSQLAEGRIELIQQGDTTPVERIVVRSADTGEEWSVSCPLALPPSIEALAVEEYHHLIAGRPVSTMDPRLFEYFFGATYCTNCRFRGERHICFGCLSAGEPVNFLPFEPEAAPPLPSP